jgi:excisionase family DNA binding protein
MESIIETNLLSPEAVAQKLGLDIRTVYRYIRSGQLNAAKFGRVYRVPTASLEEFVQKSIGGVKEQSAIKKECTRLINLIRENYNPEKIILFGSLAHGKSNAKDIDLLIVKKTNKRFYDRLREVAMIAKAKVPVDILVYTPEEVEQERVSNIFFQEEILKKGKVVYEKNP